ncbi:MAG: peptidoglycan-binding domain-containing protein [Archangium sp.]|nr:peptidoglycan-binding domain-containing protein [Archangium sp.]
MTSVRLSPRTTAPAQVQAHHAARASAPVAKKQVDGFERKSVTAQLLQRGMTGAPVTQLQQRLVAAKFMSLDDLKSGPGVYGPRTEAAVKRLQAQVGLPVTGIAAPSTLAALAGGARHQPVREAELTTPISLSRVQARLSETFTDEVTQPMGRPMGR